MPNISANGSSVIFTIPVRCNREIPTHVYLVVRCDDNDDVSVRILGLGPEEPIAERTQR